MRGGVTLLWFTVNVTADAVLMEKKMSAYKTYFFDDWGYTSLVNADSARHLGLVQLAQRNSLSKRWIYTFKSELFKRVSSSSVSLWGCTLLITATGSNYLVVTVTVKQRAQHFSLKASHPQCAKRAGLYGRLYEEVVPSSNVHHKLRRTSHWGLCLTFALFTQKEKIEVLNLQVGSLCWTRSDGWTSLRFVNVLIAKVILLVIFFFSRKISVFSFILSFGCF